MMKLTAIRRTNIVQFVALSVAVLATIFYFADNVADQQKSRLAAIKSLLQGNRMMSQLEEQKKIVDQATARNEELLRQISILTSKAPTSSESQPTALLLRQDVSDMKSELSSLRSELDRLNEALGTNPEKALALPLLKKDVDDLKDSTQRNLDDLRDEMSRSYDVSKWLIGLIVAAVLGTLLNTTLQLKTGTHSAVHKTE
jgi:hypothetical protein